MITHRNKKKKLLKINIHSKDHQSFLFTNCFSHQIICICLLCDICRVYIRYSAASTMTTANIQMKFWFLSWFDIDYTALKFWWMRLGLFICRSSNAPVPPWYTVPRPISTIPETNRPNNIKISHRVSQRITGYRDNKWTWVFIQISW